MTRFLVVSLGKTWAIVDTAQPDAVTVASSWKRDVAYEIAAVLNECDELGPALALPLTGTGDLTADRYFQ